MLDKLIYLPQFGNVLLRKTDKPNVYEVSRDSSFRKLLGTIHASALTHKQRNKVLAK